MKSSMLFPILLEIFAVLMFIKEEGEILDVCDCDEACGWFNHRWQF